MPIEGDVYAIAKALRAGSDVHSDSDQVGTHIVAVLKKVLSTPGRGRVYTTFFFTDKRGVVRPYGKRTPHRASAPGDPPAPDTGDLRASVDYNKKRLPAGTELTIGVAAEHATYDEFGTRNMQARPFFRPTMLKLRKYIQETYAKGIEQRERRKARQLGGRG